MWIVCASSHQYFPIHSQACLARTFVYSIRIFSKLLLLHSLLLSICSCFVCIWICLSCVTYTQCHSGKFTFLIRYFFSPHSCVRFVNIWFCFRFSQNEFTFTCYPPNKKVPFSIDYTNLHINRKQKSLCVLAGVSIQSK